MSRKVTKTGVIGHPISHSKSPLIHKYWIDKYDLNGAYEAIDIPPDELQTGVQELVENGFAGFNVTVPYKTAIMALCDEIDPLAKAIGAVNTVTIKNGKLYGTNTDAYGFIQNIKQHAPHFNLTQGRALILGAGGAAKAIMYALLQEGISEIILTNRTEEKAVELSRHDPKKIRVIEWNKRHESIEGVSLIVNTTSLGMTGKPPLDLSLEKASPKTLVTDIVYAPLYTELLKRAQEKNLQTVTGIGMLLHQARPGFEKWHGIMPEVTPELEKMVLA